MSSHRWTATETRTLEPFLTDHSALEGLRFRCTPDEPPSDEQVHWFDADTLPYRFTPELFLDVDTDLLELGVGIPVEDLRLAVVVRDRAVKRWDLVGVWSIGQNPLEFELPVLDVRTYAPGRRMEFVVMVTPATELPVLEGRAHLPTQVVSTRSFHVRIRRDGSRFNVATVPSEWFVEHGMLRNTVWAIDWHTRDVEREPIACLTVVVNQAHEQRLQAALSGALSDVVATQMAIDVFVEVAWIALREVQEFIDEPSTLIGTVLKVLGIRSAEQFETLKRRIDEDDDRASVLSMIRGRVQGSLDLGKQLASAGKG